MHPGKGMYGVHRTAQKQATYAVVVFLLFGFLVTSLLWFFFISGYWDIKTVDIGNLKTLEREEVLRELDKALYERPWRPWRANNLLMTDSKKISVQLRDRLFIDEIAVEKVYPNILRLKIKERQRSVVIVTDDGYFIADTTGIITALAEGEAVSSTHARLTLRESIDDVHLPVIVLKTEDPISVGFEVAKSEQVKSWLEANHKIVLEGLQVSYMKVDTSKFDLARFIAPQGYEIYLDISQPLEPQLLTYKNFIKSKRNLESIKEYIDVRVPGRVFIK